MGKIKLFTHTDLDGAGCVIISELIYGDSINVEYCDYTNVNENIKRYIDSKEFLKYDFCYITDISINEEIENIINNTHPKEYENGFMLNEHFMLLDHHPTALHLNKNYWCNVKVEIDNIKTCGTELFYRYLCEDEDHLKQLSKTSIKEFVELVKLYDTWLWKEDNMCRAKELNDLFFILGRDLFIRSIISKLEKNKYLFSDKDLEMLLINKRNIDNYIDKKSKEVIIKEIKGYKVGIVFAEQYVSELGNTLATNNLDLNFIVIISGNKISYRGIRDNIDLGQFAKMFGGGGHPKAAGSQISEEIQDQYIDMIFK